MEAGLVPTLKVTTRGADKAVEIRVRANGTGIPADIRDKLFQPFFTTKPMGRAPASACRSGRHRHAATCSIAGQRVGDTASSDKATAQPVSACKRMTSFTPSSHSVVIRRTAGVHQSGCRAPTVPKRFGSTPWLGSI